MSRHINIRAQEIIHQKAPNFLFQSISIWSTTFSLMRKAFNQVPVKELQVGAYNPLQEVKYKGKHEGYVFEDNKGKKINMYDVLI